MNNIEMDVIQNEHEIEFDINQTENLEFDINTPTGTKDYNKLFNKPQINGVELKGNKSLSDLGIDQDFVKDNNYVHTDNNFTNADKTKLASLHNYDDTEIKADIQDLERTKADKSEIENFITKDVNNLTYYTKTTGLSRVALSGSYNDLSNKPDLSNFATKTELSNEETARENADIGLQGQIDAITSSSDVKDIVGTYQELQNYDTSTLGNDDIIKVLQDNTHNDAMTYYRWVISGSSGSWQYIGQEGPYYTKSESDSLLNDKQNTIDSTHKLESDLVDDTNQTNKFVTDNEKQTWNNKIDSSALTDYVKNTDYGSTTDAGVVKSGNYGFRISNMGVGYVLRASEGNIDAKSSEYLPIVPAKLDYATKIGMTTNTLTLTDTEKEKAKSWIGANFNNTVKGKDLDLTDTTASKIQEIKLFGKSSQTVNTGSNLVQYTDDNTDYFFCNSNVIKFGKYTFVQDNGASLYFPEGAKSSGINTRLLIKKLNLEANKVYTVTVLGGRDAGYGINVAQYPVNAEEISEREAVLGQGRNFTTTFTTEADKWYMLELRTPTAGEGGARTIPFTMKIMLNEGAPKNWEPYTNGVATPTMTTPSAITSKTSETLTITDGVNTQTATLNLEVGGIPVSSGGNYTDENGQQYIADSIERYADGTGKLIKRVYTQNLPNSFTKSGSSGNFLLAVSNLDYAPKLPTSQYAISYDVMCNQFTNETWISQNGYVVVDGTKVSFADATEFNTYFAEHPLQYEYVLDTPIETALTEAQLEQLDLSMYNVNTQITSDTNLEIEYIANTKQYIDNSLRELTYNRDKYTLLADTTITEGIVQPITWTSSGDDDMYDDVVVVAENFLGNGSSAFNIGYKLSNSTDFFTTNQSNVLNATTVRNYFVETERVLPYKWKCSKRGATNAVADVVHTAIQPMTEWQDKIKEIKVYTSGTGMQFVQGRIRVYGRKRFE